MDYKIGNYYLLNISNYYFLPSLQTKVKFLYPIAVKLTNFFENKPAFGKIVIINKNGFGLDLELNEDIELTQNDLLHEYQLNSNIPLDFYYINFTDFFNSDDSLKNSENVTEEKINQNNPIPKTMEDAFLFLDENLSDDDKKYLILNGPLSVHHSLGRWIRNNWDLWNDDSELHSTNPLKFSLLNQGLLHPDEMSNYIIEQYIQYIKPYIHINDVTNINEKNLKYV